MKNLKKILSSIYDLLTNDDAPVKAKSIGTYDDTILVTVGRDMYEITIKLLERKVA